ncbi:MULTISPECIES: protein kinase domain-containing protein [Klebsiella]|uniref:protein kinase domain-containing protein n=1 Tax=Klebsiella TaxID=570 RepID=UPI001CDAD205|nr:protein kinase [Klebsiella variicola]
MSRFYDFIKSFGLDKIEDYTFVKTLNNGSALSALYKKDSNLVVVKFLICPRNDIELERFKLEYSVLYMNKLNSYYSGEGYKLDSRIFHGPKESYPLPKIVIDYKECGYGFISYFGYKYMEGVLLSEIDSTKMSTDEKCYLVYRIASALNYFNFSGYSHRDLHPNNILLLPDPQMARNDYELNNPKVIILDMGSCQKNIDIQSHLEPEIERNVDEKLVFDDNNRRLLSSFISMPPDFILKGEDTKNYDSWAVGVLFYDLIFGEKPYDPKGINDVTNLRVKKEYSSSFRNNLNTIDTSLKLIIEHLLEPSGDRRPTTDAIVRLLWNYLYNKQFSKDKEYAKYIILNGGHDPNIEHDDWG